MFVVGQVLRTLKTPGKDGTPDEHTLTWPIMFENQETGINSGLLAEKTSREAAQKTVDALNVAWTDS